MSAVALVTEQKMNVLEYLPFFVSTFLTTIFFGLPLLPRGAFVFDFRGFLCATSTPVGFSFFARPRMCLV